MELEKIVVVVEEEEVKKRSGVRGKGVKEDDAGKK